jgi:hypothetical protein
MLPSYLLTDFIYGSHVSAGGERIKNWSHMSAGGERIKNWSHVSAGGERIKNRLDGFGFELQIRRIKTPLRSHDTNIVICQS